VDGAISDTEQSWIYMESNTCCFETSLFVHKWCKKYYKQQTP
jgi:hypothetical protein